MPSDWDIAFPTPHLVHTAPLTAYPRFSSEAGQRAGKRDSPGQAPSRGCLNVLLLRCPTLPASTYETLIQALQKKKYCPS